MKKLLSISLLVFTSITIAETYTPEWFSIAKKGEAQIETGYYFTLTNSDTDWGGKSKSSATVFEVDFQYGINENISIGLDLEERSSDNVQAMSDPNFVVKFHYGKFLADLRYSFLSEEIDDKNHSFGGDSLTLGAGYIFSQNYSISLSYILPYDYKFKDDSSDYTSGAQYTAFGFYERKIDDKNLIEMGLGLLVKERNEENGDFVISNMTRYSMLSATYNYKLNQNIEFIPSFNYWNYLGDDCDIEANIKILRVKARILF